MRMVTKVIIEIRAESPEDELFIASWLEDQLAESIRRGYLIHTVNDQAEREIDVSKVEIEVSTFQGED